MVVNDHKFQKSNSSKNRTYWTCAQKAALKCHARLVTENSHASLPRIMNEAHMHAGINRRHKAGELKLLKKQRVPTINTMI